MGTKSGQDRSGSLVSWRRCAGRERELTEPTFDLNRCIGAITTSLSNKLSSGASQEYRARFGLGIVEWRVLCQLAVTPWQTGADLSQAIGLDKGSISRSLAMLSKRALIQTRSGGGRRREVALTDDGKQMHRKVLLVAQAREARLLENFTAQETDTLIALLRRLSANLADIEADAEARLAADPPAGTHASRTQGRRARTVKSRNPQAGEGTASAL